MNVLKRLKNMPFALCAAGVLAVFVAGCGKEESPAQPTQPPANAPVVYMNDPVFRKALGDKRKELKAILAERAPLAARMEELVRSHKENLAELQKLAEWNELHQKVVALNEKYEAVRKRQLAIAAERLAPVKEKISK